MRRELLRKWTCDGRAERCVAIPPEKLRKTFRLAPLSETRICTGTGSICACKSVLIQELCGVHTACLIPAAQEHKQGRQACRSV
ncbi:hypothetical protein DUNSADRAFT_4176 [Dunaliella salina]|uniref:Uncharacterized protein n=1 Tax=Dunaliella salina TaxID=3046 RepID=A0ABQ7FUY2_DUNSA|nr:hypothetical protein DUNSADRAFT_4176 [Dunaliella salina]|eukprot:KAF5826204.1 hypothetical protein DUNSADRAFT_4176 [Dunaliella salina]